MNELEPRRRNEIGPALHLNGTQSIVLGLALLYWVCPFDILPLIPIDDIIVMVLAVAIAGMLGLLDRG